ncbi:MAG: hypothetical protein ACLPWF_22315 [Bryobacteraceae bacterium]
MVLLASVFLTGCVRREGRNPDCRWPEDHAAALGPNQRGYADHLRGDVEFAEELAIEHMDAQFGPRSNKPRPQQTASQVLNTCLSSLVVEIAKTHNISPYEVVKYFGRRSLAVDAAVVLPYLALFVFFAAVLVGRLLRRYPPGDAWTVLLVIAILSSLVLAAAGVMVGEQWSGLAENIRVGNGHISYRLDRLPWVRHRLQFFVVCLALFWIAALARYRMGGWRVRARRQNAGYGLPDD